MSKVPVVWFLVVLVVVGLVSQSWFPTVEGNESKQRIPKRLFEMFEMFERSFNNADADGCASVFAEDAILFPPDAVVFQGKESIHKSYVELFASDDNVSYKAKNDPLKSSSVILKGDIAVAHNGGTEITTKNGQEAKRRYKWMVVAQRQSDGSWKTLRDFFSYDSPKE